MTQPSPVPFSPMQLPPRTRRSASIAENIRQLINEGQLQPGDRLPPECDLCRQFGVSRTTLREAIQMLRTTGLLDVSPGRGSFVRVPDVSQLLRDILFASRHGGIDQAHVAELHAVVLRESLGQMPRITPAGRQELYRHGISKTAHPHENAVAEEKWQLALVGLSGNPLQRIMLECLLALSHTNRTNRYNNPDEVMRAIHAQLRINSAITDGDWPLAERVLTQFIVLGGAPSTHVAAFPAPEPANTNIALAENE